MNERLFYPLGCILGILAICLIVSVLRRIIDYMLIVTYRCNVIHYWYYVANRYAKEIGQEWIYEWEERRDVWLEKHNLSYYKNKYRWKSWRNTEGSAGLPPELLAVYIFNKTEIKDKKKYLNWEYALEDSQGRIVHGRLLTFWKSFIDTWLVTCIAIVSFILLCVLYIHFIL